MLSDRCLSCLFVTLVYCGQTVGWIKIKLGFQVGLRPGHIVLAGDPANPPSKGGGAPNFRPMCRGQTVGWIKMKLGFQVGLGPGHIALYGTQLPPKRGQSLPIFGLCLLWPNGWMDQDATWYGGKPRPRQQCVKWGPSSPLPK